LQPAGGGPVHSAQRSGGGHLVLNLYGNRIQEAWVAGNAFEWGPDESAAPLASAAAPALLV
jgi:hypothetical protein